MASLKNISRFYDIAFQKDRFPSALDPGTVKIDSRSFQDLLLQCVRFAERVHYIGDDNQYSGRNWKEFFSTIYDKENEALDLKALKEMEEAGTIPAHLALLEAFLHLYKVEQDHLNKLTKDHLDFYYKDVLRLLPKEGNAGRVPVTFKLVKGIKSVMIPAGTRFLADKDDDGKQVFFKTRKDHTVTDISLSQTERWNMEEKKDQFGLAISSEMLNVSSGKITITFKKPVPGIAEEIQYTSPSGWMRAGVTIKNKELEFNVPTTDPICSYDSKIHGEGFDEENPIIRIIPGKDKLKDCHNLKASDLHIDTITVDGFCGFTMSNKLSEVKNEFSSQPFGPAPEKDSLLFFTSPVFSFLQKATLNSKWDQSQKMRRNISQAAINKQASSFHVSLLSDFGRSEYPLKLAVAMNQGITATTTSPEVTLPPLPYVPTLSEPISLNITLGSGKTKVYSISPAGIAKCMESAGSVIWEEAYDGVSDKLFLGLVGVIKGKPISIHLNLEGTSLILSNGISVSCLSGDKWEEAKITLDTTSNLNKSGILELSIPEDIEEGCSILPSGVSWLRIQRLDGGQMPLKCDLTLHATELEYDPLSPGKEPVGVSLPQETISKPEFRIPGIASVIQFTQGTCGKAMEDEMAFYTRVSERLRHKGRAWNSWDYQRLILERFPEIAAVKCLRNTEISRNEGKSRYAPGSLILMLVPKISDSRSQFKPLVSDATLTDVHDYIKELTSTFVTLYVMNPSYEEVQVECSFSLKEGFDDKEYYTTLTEQMISQIFAPWIESGKEIQFNDTLNESGVLGFIEKLPWVDFVKKLIIKVSGKEIEEGADITPTDDMCILTSASTHKISII